MCVVDEYATDFNFNQLIRLDYHEHDFQGTGLRIIHRRLYWSDYSIDQSNYRTVVTCQNKFTTPPHQCRRMICPLK